MKTFAHFLRFQVWLLSTRSSQEECISERSLQQHSPGETCSVALTLLMEAGKARFSCVCAVQSCSEAAWHLEFGSQRAGVCGGCTSASGAWRRQRWRRCCEVCGRWCVTWPRCCCCRQPVCHWFRWSCPLPPRLPPPHRRCWGETCAPPSPACAASVAWSASSVHSPGYCGRQGASQSCASFSHSSRLKHNMGNFKRGPPNFALLFPIVVGCNTRWDTLNEGQAATQHGIF